MAIIPQRKQQNRAGIPQGGEADVTAGRAFGEAFGAAGQGVAKAVGQISDYADEKEKSDKAASSAEAKEKSETDANDAADEAIRANQDTNGDNLASDFDASYAKKFKEYTKDMDKDKKKDAELYFKANRTEVRKQLQADARKMDLSFKQKTTEDYLNVSTANVYQNPDRLDSSILDTSTRGKEILRLQGESAKNYDLLTKRQLTLGAVRGLTDRGRYKQAEELATKNADIFGVVKGDSSSGFKSTPELIDEIRAQKSRQLDQDVKLVAAEERAAIKAAQDGRNKTEIDLADTVTKVKDSKNVSAQQDVLKQIDILEGSKLISTTAARYQKGRFDEPRKIDTKIEEKAIFEISTKMFGGASRADIEAEIQRKVNAGEITYGAGENLIRRNANLHRDKAAKGGQSTLVRDRTIADKYIKASIPLKTKYGRMLPKAGLQQVEALERTEELRRNGMNYSDASKQAVEEIMGTVDDVPLVKNVPAKLQDNIGDLAKAGKLAEAAYNRNKTPANYQKLITTLKGLQDRKNAMLREQKSKKGKK